MINVSKGLGGGATVIFEHSNGNKNAAGMKLSAKSQSWIARDVSSLLIDYFNLLIKRGASAPRFFGGAPGMAHSSGSRGGVRMTWR